MGIETQKQCKDYIRPLYEEGKTKEGGREGGGGGGREGEITLDSSRLSRRTNRGKEGGREGKGSFSPFSFLFSPDNRCLTGFEGICWRWWTIARPGSSSRYVSHPLPPSLLPSLPLLLYYWRSPQCAGSHT